MSAVGCAATRGWHETAKEDAHTFALKPAKITDIKFAKDYIKMTDLQKKEVSLHRKSFVGVVLYPFAQFCPDNLMVAIWVTAAIF